MLASVCSEPVNAEMCELWGLKLLEHTSAAVSYTGHNKIHSPLTNQPL